MALTYFLELLLALIYYLELGYVNWTGRKCMWGKWYFVTVVGIMWSLNDHREITQRPLCDQTWLRVYVQIEVWLCNCTMWSSGITGPMYRTLSTVWQLSSDFCSSSSEAMPILCPGAPHGGINCIGLPIHTTSGTSSSLFLLFLTHINIIQPTHCSIEHSLLPLPTIPIPRPLQQ